MFKSKINLFGRSWIDTVFEERNKEYGAYEMRKKESGITVRALIIGAVIFCLFVTLPLIVKHISESIGGLRTFDEKIVMVTIEPPPDVPREDLPPPPPPKEVKTLQDIKKFTPPVVAPEEEVVEELATQKDLETAKAGAQNVDATADGDILLDERPTDQVAVAIVEDTKIYDQTTVQVEPRFPGGLSKFREYIASNLEGRSFDIPTNELRMEFRFVIERDGRLTDIQIVNNGGSPEAAEMAVKVLNSCPRWTPASINGKPVRMLFSIPIIIRLL